MTDFTMPPTCDLIIIKGTSANTELFNYSRGTYYMLSGEDEKLKGSVEELLAKNMDSDNVMLSEDFNKLFQKSIDTYCDGNAESAVFNTSINKVDSSLDNTLTELINNCDKEVVYIYYTGKYISAQTWLDNCGPLIENINPNRKVYFIDLIKSPTSDDKLFFGSFTGQNPIIVNNKSDVNNN